MKIGLVLDDGLDAPDGVQQYVLTIGNWLIQQGHDVHYLAGQTARTDLPNVHSLGKNVRIRFNHNRLSIPFHSSTKQLRELLSTQDFDVLHVQLPYSPRLAGKIIANANPKTAVVGTFHILPYGRLQAWGSTALSKIIAATLRRFDAVVAVSEAAQQFAKQRMNIDASLLPNAVNLATFAQGKPIKKFADGKTNVVFLGRLVARKGAMELLRAVEMLYTNGDFSNHRLIIAGTGPESDKIKTYIASHQLSKIVTMTGWVTEAEKPNYLRTADVAVLPSMSGESFGIVVVEAIAAGAGAVLGGDNPGYRFVLGNDPRALVDPRDTLEFAQRLRQLLVDPTLRAALQSKQRSHIQAYDISVVGPQLLQLYSDAIAKRTKNEP